jgi:NAD-dependent deacetylase
MPIFNSIVVLTGAGISAESGIRTFRAADGLWEDHRVEDVATPEAFIKDPNLVHSFYNARRQQLISGIKANPAHLALAQFEQKFSGNFSVITQNIDNLHELAGSKKLIHMHGELLKSRCKKTGVAFTTRNDTAITDNCPCCDQPSNVRPHIVWFGEMPLFMDEIGSLLSDCDLFVAIGTSGNVYPAAGFYQMAKSAGAHTVEINLENTSASSCFNEQHMGLASEQVPLFLNSLKFN